MPEKHSKRRSRIRIIKQLTPEGGPVILHDEHGSRLVEEVAAKPPKRPRDLNQWGRRMVDLATGATSDPDPNKGKDPAAVALGRKGGLKGGKARAASLSSAQLRASARKAAKARWSKKPTK